MVKSRGFKPLGGTKIGLTNRRQENEGKKVGFDSGRETAFGLGYWEFLKNRRFETVFSRGNFQMKLTGMLLENFEFNL